MSGIEIAGLVLGAFPLAIECISCYSNGIKRIKDMRNYQQILRQFARDLGVEKCKYDNTVLELLTEVAGPAKIKRMMANLNSPEWDDQAFRSHLKDRLRPADETLDNWLDLTKQLNETLETVIRKFQLPPENAVKQSTWGRPRTSAKFDPRVAWEIGMLSSYRTDEIARIRQLNADLRELANGGNPSTTIGVKSSSSISNTRNIGSSPLIAYHKRIQHRAKSVSNMLSEKLESPICRCDKPYCVHLELKMRSTPPTNPRPQADIHGPNQSLTFSLMFSTQESNHKFSAMWQELWLEPLADDDSDSPMDENLNTKSLREGRRRTPLQTAGILKPSPYSSTSSPSTASGRGRSPERTSQGFLSVLTPKLGKFRNMFSRTPSPNPSSRLCTPHEVRPHATPASTPATTSQPSTIPVKKRARFENDNDEDNELNTIFLHGFSAGETPTIPCFCTTLTTHDQKTPPKCVGLLITTDKEEHRVWSPLQKFPKPARFVSLADLITCTNINTPIRQDRLVLGLKLVSSVLQLSTTQWLTEIWEAKDILFPEADLQNAGKDHNILARPLVHQKFNTCNTVATDNPRQQQANLARAVVGCNQSLYSLGIVLIEIWYWKTFNLLQNSSEGGLSELLSAYQLSDKMFTEAGRQYGMAVRRCIRGLDMPETDLEDPVFRKKVYQDILGELEENLKTFCGSNCIQKIIGEE